MLTRNCSELMLISTSVLLMKPADKLYPGCAAAVRFPGTRTPADGKNPTVIRYLAPCSVAFASETVALMVPQPA